MGMFKKAWKICDKADKNRLDRFVHMIRVKIKEAADRGDVSATVCLGLDFEPELYLDKIMHGLDTAGYKVDKLPDAPYFSILVKWRPGTKSQVLVKEGAQNHPSYMKRNLYT